jgi:restriction system protein
MTLWLVRSGRHGEGDDLAVSNGVVGIGWPEAGDLTGLPDIDAIRGRIMSGYPDKKPTTVSNWVGQVDAFMHRVTIGDLVALPLKTSPTIAIGQVTGEYRYVPAAIPEMRHQRSVSWLREDLPRVAVPQDILYSLGAFMTVCRIRRNDAEARIRALLDGPVIPSPTTPSTSPLNHDDLDAPTDVAQLARDQVRGRIGEQFHGHDLARLVDEVLRADGFRTDLSPPGPDGGVDILAGEGELGFEGVRLAVQVKSGAQVVDASTVRELQGVMSNFGAKQGLIVSWGGFTKTAKAEGRRLYFQLRLWDADDLIAKVGEVYERLPQEIRSELPLQRVWALTPGDEV